MPIICASYGGIDYGDDGIAMKASGLLSVTTSTTNVLMGRGMWFLKVLVHETEADTGDELYNIDVMANTKASATSFAILGPGVVLGASAVTGRDFSNSATLPSAVTGAFYNPYNNQCHLRLSVAGTVASGINYEAKAYQMNVHP